MRKLRIGNKLLEKKVPVVHDIPDNTEYRDPKEFLSYDPKRRGVRVVRDPQLYTYDATDIMNAINSRIDNITSSSLSDNSGLNTDIRSYTTTADTTWYYINGTTNTNGRR